MMARKLTSLVLILAILVFFGSMYLALTLTPMVNSLGGHQVTRLYALPQERAQALTQVVFVEDESSTNGRPLELSWSDAPGLEVLSLEPEELAAGLTLEVKDQTLFIRSKAGAQFPGGGRTAPTPGEAGRECEPSPGIILRLPLNVQSIRANTIRITPMKEFLSHLRQFICRLEKGADDRVVNRRMWRTDRMPSRFEIIGENIDLEISRSWEHRMELLRVVGIAPMCPAKEFLKGQISISARGIDTIAIEAVSRKIDLVQSPSVGHILINTLPLTSIELQNLLDLNVFQWKRLSDERFREIERLRPCTQSPALSLSAARPTANP